MNYNSVENAEQFITEQIEWCKVNRYLDFTIWSNGKELYACTDTVTGKKPIEEAMKNLNNFKSTRKVPDYFPKITRLLHFLL